MAATFSVEEIRALSIPTIVNLLQERGWAIKSDQLAFVIRKTSPYSDQMKYGIWEVYAPYKTSLADYNHRVFECISAIADEYSLSLYGAYNLILSRSQVS